MSSIALPITAAQDRSFRTKRWDFPSFFFTGVTGLSTLLILLILFVILGNIVLLGSKGFSWRFITAGTEQNMFDVNTAGVLPMIVGTTARVFIMTIFVIPIGVITAIYLSEYASATSPITRTIRAAISNLAGVPSIVFGLFGLGFFINFAGKNMDALFHPAAVEPIWGKPAIIWAS